MVGQENLAKVSNKHTKSVSTSSTSNPTGNLLGDTVSFRVNLWWQYWDESLKPICRYSSPQYSLTVSLYPYLVMDLGAQGLHCPVLLLLLNKRGASIYSSFIKAIQLIMTIFFAILTNGSAVNNFCQNWIFEMK